MSNIKSVSMKLTSGSTPPQPPAPATTSAARTTVPEVSSPAPAQQLDALQLANRETALARVAQIINRQGSQLSELVLDIRGKSLPVQANVGNTELAPGDWVKVVRAGNELQLMGKLAPALEAGIAKALAQRLPGQMDLASGLEKLLSSLTLGVRAPLKPGQLPSTTPATPLPEAARKALGQLLTRLPGSESFSPGAGTRDQSVELVRQWLSESGVFAESRLVQTPSQNLPDLKLALGRIITALLARQGETPEQFNRLTPLASPQLVSAPLQFPLSNPQTPATSTEAASTGQLLRLLAGMLNRITVNQLHSQVLSARAGGDPQAPMATVLLDLPWLTASNEPRVAQLRMEQYPDKQDRPERNSDTPVYEWHLTLAMDLDEAGPLHFDVSLRQHTVSARVWAGKQSTLRQVNQELPKLRQSLSELGLEVGDLECRQGTPRSQITRLEHRLVDTRA